MVMTFLLYPLSHYNFITEPRARFLLSLIKDLSIDFPSHFILSLIDVYKDMATCDKLIFPSTITRIIRPSTPSSSAGGVTLEAIMAQLERMDARLGTFTTELYQVNTRVLPHLLHVIESN